MTGSHRKRVLLLAVLAGLAPAVLAPARGWAAQPVTGTGPNGAAGPVGAGEEFHYRWQLGNLVGYLAGLFLPRSGNGELTFRDDHNGHLLTELVITSPDGHDGEYFRYGSEIDDRTLQPLRAWTSYFWRGRSKSKVKEIEQKGVLDIVSGLYVIRRQLPQQEQRLEIWSDGDIFPAAIIPRGREKRLIGGRPIDTLHYAIRPVSEPGRPRWKGKIDFWFATDPAATPVEIDISRSLADVRLVLQSGMSPPAG
jgi:hypothetical protein